MRKNKGRTIVKGLNKLLDLYKQRQKTLDREAIALESRRGEVDAVVSRISSLIERENNGS